MPKGCLPMSRLPLGAQRSINTTVGKRKQDVLSFLHPVMDPQIQPMLLRLKFVSSANLRRKPFDRYPLTLRIGAYQPNAKP